MKNIFFWRSLIISNLLTASIMFYVTVSLKRKEVQRRNEVIMSTLVGNVASLKLLKNERAENAKKILIRNVELIVDARKVFSPFGYDGWEEMDTYLIQEGILE
jgi:hypothetical protein